MQRLLVYTNKNLESVVAEITWTPKEGIQVSPHDADGALLLEAAVQQIKRHAALPLIMEEMGADNALVMKHFDVAPDNPLYLRALGDMLGANYDYSCDWLIEDD